MTPKEKAIKYPNWIICKCGKELCIQTEIDIALKEQAKEMIKNIHNCIEEHFYFTKEDLQNLKEKYI